MVLGEGEAALGKPASLTISSHLCQICFCLALSYPAKAVLPGLHRVRRTEFWKDGNRSYFYVSRRKLRAMFGGDYYRL